MAIIIISLIVASVTHVHISFICSGKFWRKVQFISTLQDLSSYVSIDDDFIAAPVLAVDQAIMSRQAARRRYQSEHHGVSQKDATASVADS